MPEILLNNKRYEKKIEGDKTLDQLIENVLTDARPSDILTDLYLDDERFDDTSVPKNEKLDNYKKIQVIIKSDVEIAYEALDSCSTYIDSINKSIMEMVTYYNKSELDNANTLFGDMVDHLDIFVQLMGQIHRAIKNNYSGELTHSESIQKLEIHLLSILKALIPAKENEDIIMLCDLLEYELIDNLTQWKIKIIPDLKGLREEISQDSE